MPAATISKKAAVKALQAAGLSKAAALTAWQQQQEQQQDQEDTSAQARKRIRRKLNQQQQQQEQEGENDQLRRKRIRLEARLQAVHLRDVGSADAVEVTADNTALEALEQQRHEREVARQAAAAREARAQRARIEARLEEHRRAQAAASAEEQARDAARTRVLTSLQQELGEYIACGNLELVLRTLGTEFPSNTKSGPQQLQAALRRAKVLFHPDRVPQGDGGVTELERRVRFEEVSKILNSWVVRGE